MIPELDSLISIIKAVPGIGPKAATRIALFFIENPNLSINFSYSVQKAVETIGTCYQCGNISPKGKLCTICSDPKRDRSLVAIVSNITDVFAIDKSDIYNGLYYVFTNINDLFTQKEVFDRDISRLKSYLNALSEEDSNVREVIFALPYNIDSEVACSVISENLSENYPDLNFSRIALGMPSGADFDYTDKLTIMKSFKGRTKLEA